MINKDELLFAVDEDNNPIEPVQRFRAHKEGIWHRNAHVWIINSKQEALCNKRSMSKDHNPGKWEAFFGGHVLAGASPMEGALQELREELDLTPPESDLKLWKIIKCNFEPENKEYIYVYILFWDGNIKDIDFEKAEMDQIKWAPLAELKKFEENNDPSWTTYPYLLELLNYLEKNYAR